MISFHYANFIWMAGLFCALGLYFSASSQDKGTGIGGGILSGIAFLVGCLILAVSIIIFLLVKP